jgi:hypothetical protein
MAEVESMRTYCLKTRRQAQSKLQRAQLEIAKLQSQLAALEEPGGQQEAA